MYPASGFLSVLNDPRWIIVANLPREANEAWLRMLFTSVGTVEAVEFATHEGPGTAFILFATAEQAISSLRLNGFVALGIAIQVRPRNMALLGQSILGTPILTRTDPESLSPATRLRPHATIVDTKPTHKNLYVLNLPLDASTDQLTALFGSYGTVVHCVILAMLDAQARRRGFIDMSSPKEAKEAIEGLNGFVWHGYPMEVSYAIVQRSGGPFDQVTGRNIIKRNVPRNRFNTGPRRVPSDSAMAADYYTGEAAGGTDFLSASDTYQLPLFNKTPSNPAYLAAFKNETLEEDSSPSATDPFTIFVAGLDPVAIIDDEDFRHALRPYGSITAATLCRDEQGTSRGFGIVTFANQDEASRACDDLNGKVINGRRMSAHKYVYQTQSHPALVRPNMNFAAVGNPFSPSTAVSPGTLGPLSLPRRSGTDSMATTMPYCSGNLLQALQPPVSGITRFNSRSPQSLPVWPPTAQSTTALAQPQQMQNRLDQIPMGSIGSSALSNSNEGKWNPSSGAFFRPSGNMANFFQAAKSVARPVEIKPDLRSTGLKSMGSIGSDKTGSSYDKQLGDAFMPMPKSSASSSERFSDATVKNDGVGKKDIDDQADVSPGSGSGFSSTNPSCGTTLLRTPGASTSPWSHSRAQGGNPNGSNLDAMSPESAMTLASSASSPVSQLNTPETARGADSTLIWGPTAAHDRMSGSIRSSVSPGSWLSNTPGTAAEKRVANMNGSAILSLQSIDAVESKSGRNGSLNTMAPVGHEKTSSSPLRVMRPFQEEGEMEAAQT